MNLSVAAASCDASVALYPAPSGDGCIQSVSVETGSGPLVLGGGLVAVVVVMCLAIIAVGVMKRGG